MLLNQNFSYVPPPNYEVRNWVTKSSYEVKLRKRTSNFELLTLKFSQKFLIGVINLGLEFIKLNLEFLTQSRKSIRILLRGYIALGSWDIQVQSFHNMTFN